MIRAVDALRLPSAQLSKAEIAEVEKILSDMESNIHKGMKRNGFEYQTGCANAAVAFEVSMILQENGYVVNVQPLQGNPQIQVRGAPPTIIGYYFFVAPGKDAIEASRHLLQ